MVHRAVHRSGQEIIRPLLNMRTKNLCSLVLLTNQPSRLGARRRGQCLMGIPNIRGTAPKNPRRTLKASRVP